MIVSVSAVILPRAAAAVTGGLLLGLGVEGAERRPELRGVPAVGGRVLPCLAGLPLGVVQAAVRVAGAARAGPLAVSIQFVGLHHDLLPQGARHNNHERAEKQQGKPARHDYCHDEPRNHVMALGE